MEAEGRPLPLHWLISLHRLALTRGRVRTPRRLAVETRDPRRQGPGGALWLALIRVPASPVCRVHPSPAATYPDLDRPIVRKSGARLAPIRGKSPVRRRQQRGSARAGDRGVVDAPATITLPVTSLTAKAIRDGRPPPQPGRRLWVLPAVRCALQAGSGADICR